MSNGDKRKNNQRATAARNSFFVSAPLQKRAKTPNFYVMRLATGNGDDDRVCSVPQSKPEAPAAPDKLRQLPGLPPTLILSGDSHLAIAGTPTRRANRA